MLLRTGVRIGFVALQITAACSGGDETADRPTTTVAELDVDTTTTATTASERSFEISRVVIAATVEADGSMEVVERMLYDFDGEFNGGTRTIPPGSYTIANFTVTEDGEARDLAPGFDDPNSGEVRWYGSTDHSMVTGPHMYQLRYRVDRAVVAHPDVAELYWQFVGDEFPALRGVSIEVTMPGDGTGLRAFAHGDLSGIVVTDANVVATEVTTNPAGSPVELRILAPAETFAGLQPTGSPVLDGILAEEQRRRSDVEAAAADAAEDYDNEIGRGLEPTCADDPDAATEAACDQLSELLAVAGERTVGTPLTVEDAKRFAAILEARRAVQQAAGD